MCHKNLPTAKTVKDDEFYTRIEDVMCEVVKYVDVICDGPFIESLKSPDLKWVGSSNQHVIDVNKRIEKVSSLV